MPYQFPPDVEKLVKQHMLVGGYDSEDEVLRDALQALGAFVHPPEAATQEYRNAVEAIREGVDDVNAGRITPLRSLLEESNGTPLEGK